MSCNYADGLSPYHDKGQVGLDEKFDSKSVVTAKVALLAKWMNEAKHVVIHTGAGISTSAGIPDFRGPRGVWTLQAKGQKPDASTDFNEAIPTPTHMAITKLVEREKVKYVVSQNIDGLHLRSNLQRKYLSELHGNMFTEQCNQCNRQFVRNSAVHTVGQKSLSKACPTVKANGRPCRGRLHDTILDWEHSLPENDLGMADFHSCLSDLSVCLGTTMQIVPSGNLPLYTKKHGGRLVICNLQPTKHDRKADLLIHAYVDEVIAMLMSHLKLKIPKYTTKNDPTKSLTLSPDKYFEWTISDHTIKKMRKVYEEKCGTKEARKRLEMIDDEEPLANVLKNARRSGRGHEKDEKRDDSDLEVVDVIVKPKKTPKETLKKGQKRTTTYNTTITVKKVKETQPPPSKKAKYEGEKITIKKNVTPTKTKYEIVKPSQPAKEKKKVKCEIVYSQDDVCNDLEMICESDDDESGNNFTTNFRRYLYDEKTLKKEEVKEEKEGENEEVTEKEGEKEEVIEKEGEKEEVKDKIEEKEEVKEEEKEVKETEGEKREDKDIEEGREEVNEGKEGESDEKNLEGGSGDVASEDGEKVEGGSEKVSESLETVAENSEVVEGSKKDIDGVEKVSNETTNEEGMSVEEGTKITEASEKMDVDSKKVSETVATDTESAAPQIAEQPPEKTIQENVSEGSEFNEALAKETSTENELDSLIQSVNTENKPTGETETLTTLEGERKLEAKNAENPDLLENSTSEFSIDQFPPISTDTTETVETFTPFNQENFYQKDFASTSETTDLEYLLQ